MQLEKVISTTIICACRRKVPLRCTKWPPELKFGKKLILSGFYRLNSMLDFNETTHPEMYIWPACSAPLHKMAARAINRKNIVRLSQVELHVVFI
jgi:hypothetical protein